MRTVPLWLALLSNVAVLGLVLVAAHWWLQ